MIVFIGNLPGANFILGNPLSRSREYSADQLGTALANDSTGECLMILAVGKHAYKDINLEEYEQYQFMGEFWATLSNALSDHSITAWRIGAISTLSPKLLQSPKKVSPNLIHIKSPPQKTHPQFLESGVYSVFIVVVSVLSRIINKRGLL